MRTRHQIDTVVCKIDEKIAISFGEPLHSLSVVSRKVDAKKNPKLCAFRRSVVFCSSFGALGGLLDPSNATRKPPNPLMNRSATMKNSLLLPGAVKCKRNFLVSFFFDSALKPIHFLTQLENDSSCRART